MKFSKHILHVILCTAVVLFVFLGSTASAAFILKDTNKELGGYVRAGATYNITESKNANAYFTSSDIASVEIGSGKITAKANGAATITVYSKLTAATKNDDPSNVTASAKVYVHNHDGNGRYTAIDSFHHFRDCNGTNCHFTSDISQRKYYGEHIFNSDNVCSYCGYEAKKIAGHTHTWKLTSNSGLHWYVCENSDCGATKDPEIHNFGSDNKCKLRIDASSQLVGDAHIARFYIALVCMLALRCPKGEYAPLNPRPGQMRR